MHSEVLGAEAGCHRWLGAAMATLVLLLVGAGGARASNPLCVNSSGGHGCYATIQAAIDAVSAPGTTIVVAPGTYTASCAGPACSVAAISSGALNGSALSGLNLRCGKGEGRSVVLDATGLDHAVYVSAVNGVTVDGCVAENAEREGILVENSDNVHVANNEVENNDRAMAKTAGTGTPPCPTFLSPRPGGPIQCCPDAYSGGPGNFPNDNDDCGEGIHLRSVTNSVVEDNLVHDNIGGILLTDETGPNHGNLIVGNTSRDNRAFGGDCGITLPSHLECAAGSTDATGCTLAPPVAGVFQAYGVYNNEVIGNRLLRNGAAGTGMFANPGAPPGAATKAYGNLISRNVIEDNGQPGVAIHVHGLNGNADNNVITDNVIRGNGGDAEAEPSSPKMGIEVLSNGAFPPFGPASPILGTIISGNKVSNEDIDVWVGNTATDADVFLNNLIGSDAIGVKNGGTGTVTATDNWWGCPQGPNAGRCSSTLGSVVSSPFLLHPANPER